MISNILFHLQSAKKWDEKLFWYQFVSVIPQAGFTFLSIFLPSYIVSMLQTGADLTVMLFKICGIVLTMALCNIVSSGMEQYLYRNSMSLTLFYEQQCFRKMTGIPYHSLEEKDTHSLLGNIFNGFRNEYMIRNSVTSFSALLESILASCLYGYFVLRIHFVLFLMITVSVFLNFIFLNRTRKKQNRVYQQIGEPMKMASYVKRHCMERADGKDIRIYQMQDWFIQKYDTAVTKLGDLYGKIHNFYFLRALGELSIHTVAEFVCYVFMTVRLANGAVTIPEFVFAIGVIQTFSGRFASMIYHIQGQNGIQAFLTNLRKLLSYPEEDEGGQFQTLDTTNGISIELKNVSFRYEEAAEDVLKDINLTIHSGEKLALIGLNGAGKTTLVKLLCGFYEPTRGEILINGKPKNSYSQKDFISKVSSLFQDSFVFPLSLDENLTSCDENGYDEKKLQQALVYSGFQNAYERCAQKGKTLLVREVNENATDFSGGEKQKLLFARALYKQAKFLILDEPTAALDPIAENELYQNFGKAAKDNTVLFISHRLSSTRFCDRIILLEGAQIQEEGTHEELMKKQGRYAELFEIQSKYYKESEEQEVACHE